jgi:hypothetical protein
LTPASAPAAASNEASAETAGSPSAALNAEVPDHVKFTPQDERALEVEVATRRAFAEAATLFDPAETSSAATRPVVTPVVVSRASLALLPVAGQRSVVPDATLNDSVVTGAQATIAGLDAPAIIEVSSLDTASIEAPVMMQPRHSSDGPVSAPSFSASMATGDHYGAALSATPGRQRRRPYAPHPTPPVLGYGDNTLPRSSPLTATPGRYPVPPQLVLMGTGHVSDDSADASMPHSHQQHESSDSSGVDRGTQDSLLEEQSSSAERDSIRLPHRPAQRVAERLIDMADSSVGTGTSGSAGGGASGVSSEDASAEDIDAAAEEEAAEVRRRTRSRSATVQRWRDASAHAAAVVSIDGGTGDTRARLIMSPLLFSDNLRGAKRNTAAGANTSHPFASGVSALPLASPLSSVSAHPIASGIDRVDTSQSADLAARARAYVLQVRALQRQGDEQHAQQPVSLATPLV